MPGAPPGSGRAAHPTAAGRAATGRTLTGAVMRREPHPGVGSLAEDLP